MNALLTTVISIRVQINRPTPPPGTAGGGGGGGSHYTKRYIIFLSGYVVDLGYLHHSRQNIDILRSKHLQYAARTNPAADTSCGRHGAPKRTEFFRRYEGQNTSPPTFVPRRILTKTSNASESHYEYIKNSPNLLQLINPNSNAPNGPQQRDADSKHPKT